MKIGTFILVICFFPLLFFAQERQLDSTLQVALSQSSSKENKAEAFLLVSMAYTDKDPVQSLEYAQNSFSLFSSLKEVDKAALHVQMGTLHFNSGNYHEALQDFIHAVSIGKKVNDLNGLAACYGNIGNVYIVQENLVKAMEYYREALKIDLILNDTTRLCNDYQTIGSVFLKSNSIDSARFYLTRSLKLATEIKFDEMIRQSYANLGSVYDSEAKPKEALQNFLFSFDLCQKANDSYGMALVANNVATQYLKLKDVAKAEVYSKMALQLATEMALLDEQKNAFKNLADIRQAQGNYKEAFDYYRQFTQLKDTIFNHEKSRQMVEANTRFDVEKKDQEIKMKSMALSVKDAEEKRRTLQRNILIMGLVLLLALALFIFRVSMQRKKANLLIAAQKEEVEEKKKLIEEKQTEILDSIRYAKRIQMAQIPNEKRVHQILNRTKKKSD